MFTLLKVAKSAGNGVFCNCFVSFMFSKQKKFSTKRLFDQRSKFSCRLNNELSDERENIVNHFLYEQTPLISMGAQLQTNSAVIRGMLCI